MSRIDDLRRTYQAQLLNAPEGMMQLYQGIALGIDLAAGAAAEDRNVELREERERLMSQAVAPTWKREAPNGTRAPRDPNKEVTVYALVDPRDGQAFYVGSSIDPEKQLQDYIRSDDVSISAKPMIEEIIGVGTRPDIQVLETGVRVSDVGARKEAQMALLSAGGAKLVNQRR